VTRLVAKGSDHTNFELAAQLLEDALGTRMKARNRSPGVVHLSPGILIRNVAPGMCPRGGCAWLAGHAVHTAA